MAVKYFLLTYFWKHILEKYSHAHDHILLAHFFLVFVHSIQSYVEELRIYLFYHRCRQEHSKTIPEKANLVLSCFYSIL